MNLCVAGLSALLVCGNASAGCSYSEPMSVSSSEVVTGSFAGQNGTPDASFLKSIERVKIVVAIPPNESLPLGEELQRAGLTQSLLIKTIQTTLLNTRKPITSDANSPLLLSVSVLASTRKSNQRNPIIAVSVGLSLSSTVDVPLDNDLVSSVPALLWESYGVWPTTRSNLRKEVLQAIDSRVRAFLATRGNQTNTPGMGMNRQNPHVGYSVQVQKGTHLAEVTVQHAAIRAVPKSDGLLLNKVARGTFVVVTGDKDGYYSILMADDSTGYLLKEQARFVKYEVIRPR